MSYHPSNHFPNLLILLLGQRLLEPIPFSDSDKGGVHRGWPASLLQGHIETNHHTHLQLQVKDSLESSVDLRSIRRSKLNTEWTQQGFERSQCEGKMTNYTTTQSTELLNIVQYLSWACVFWSSALQFQMWLLLGQTVDWRNGTLCLLPWLSAESLHCRSLLPGG